MICSGIFMLLSNAFLMLRLGNGSNGSFPHPLSAADEKKYVDMWTVHGDLEARNKLVEHNLRLVAHIIKKYYTQTAEQDDLISIGTIGLIKGVSTYRSDKNVRLATYASRCIENEVLMYFRSIRKCAGDVSLSDSIDIDGDGNSLSLMDILAEDDDMLENLSMIEMRNSVRGYIDRVLDDREKDIINMRYGLAGKRPQTQREVAASYGISRSYVSRIEKKALEKLHNALKE